MNGVHPIAFRVHCRPEACRRCVRRIGLGYGWLFWIGPDRRPVSRECFERETRELAARAVEGLNVVDLVAYRECKRFRAPVSLD